MKDAGSQLGRGILGFWSVWFTIVLASNLSDLLVFVGWLGDAWAFRSGNAGLIETSISVYGLGRLAAGVLIAGVVAWQLAASVLFWRAALERDAGAAGISLRARTAFAVSLGFWGALLVADELFLVYRHADVTTVHWAVVTAELVSYLVLRLPSATATPGTAS